MREIKFRGQDTANGEWIYGSLCKNIKGQYGIQVEEGEFKWKYVKRIDLKSTGQYTGLKDKKGKEIYEGDIVKVKTEDYTFNASIRYEIGSFMITADEADIWTAFSDNWNDNVKTLTELYWEQDVQEGEIHCLEVIGNVYEKPELLGVE